MRKAEPTVQLRQADKDPTVKALFAFADESVLAEGLGGGAGHKCAKLFTFISLEKSRFTGLKRLHVYAFSSLSRGRPALPAFPYWTSPFEKRRKEPRWHLLCFVRAA